MHPNLFFFTYSFLGWVCECIYCSIPAKKFINRGFLAGPYCPIYGCGALLVLYLLKPFLYQPLLLFIMGMIVTSFLEYFTSWIMELLFHTKWWDYTNYRFNIHGRVCLRNSFLFGIMSLVVCYIVHPSIIHIANMIPDFIKWITNGLMMIIFAYDFAHTTMALLRKNKDFAIMEASIKELHHDFKTATIFPLEEPLSVSVQRILDATDADENLIASLENMHNKLSVTYKKAHPTWSRLQKAFPNQSLNMHHKDIEDFFLLIHNRLHNKK